MLPSDAAERKGYPIFSGVLRYFPDAIAEVARISKIGNDQHNPGQPLHWAKHKSQDQHDCCARHLIESGTRDSDGERHTAKLAWRALAALQIEIEAEQHGMTVVEYNKALQDSNGGPVCGTHSTTPSTSVAPEPSMPSTTTPTTSPSRT